MDFPDDIERLRLPPSMTSPIRSSHRPPRHRSGERFLKGPIPWAWLDRAGRLPGKALAVGLIIWQKAGVSGNGTVRLCQSKLSDLGLNEASVRRGIIGLERAGLIEVKRRPGRGLDVRLKEARDGEDTEDLTELS
jgi:hypothetical protein